LVSQFADEGLLSSNDVVALETAAAGTSFGASDTAKSVFGTLFDGDKWMIYYNTVTKVLHWDYVCLLASPCGQLLKFHRAPFRAS
jgi:hypothetical protein